MSDGKARQGVFAVTPSLAILLGLFAAAAVTAITCGNIYLTGTPADIVNSFGVALATAATVGFPLEWMAHRHLTEAAKEELAHLRQDARELGTKSTLGHFVPQPLVETIAKKVLNQPMMENLVYDVTLLPRPDDASLSFAFAREYQVVNRSLDEIEFAVLHFDEPRIIGSTDDDILYREIHFELRNTDDDTKIATRLFSPLELDLANEAKHNEGQFKWHGQDDIIISPMPDHIRRQISCNVRLPRDSRLLVRIATCSSAELKGNEPLTVSRVAASMSLRVTHSADTFVDAFPMHALEQRFERLPRAGVELDGRTLGRTQWDIHSGLFPGQGVQLRWVHALLPFHSSIGGSTEPDAAVSQ